MISFNRTRHNMMMAFDDEYREKYKIFYEGRRELLVCYYEVIKKSPSMLLILAFCGIFSSVVFNPVIGILTPVVIHTIAWFSVAVPEYLKLRKELNL